MTDYTLRSDKAEDFVKINKLEMKCHRWRFKPDEAQLVFSWFLVRRYALLASIVFLGDGDILVAEDATDRFEEILDEIGIIWQKESQWIKVRTAIAKKKETNEEGM